MKESKRKFKNRNLAETPKPFVENNFQDFSRIEEYTCFYCENDTETENDTTDTESVTEQSVNNDLGEMSDEETRKNYSFITKDCKKKIISVLLEEEEYISD